MKNQNSLFIRSVTLLFTKNTNPLISFTIPSQRRCFFNSCTNLDRVKKPKKTHPVLRDLVGAVRYEGGGWEFPAKNAGSGDVSEAVMVERENLEREKIEVCKKYKSSQKRRRRRRKKEWRINKNKYFITLKNYLNTKRKKIRNSHETKCIYIYFFKKLNQCTVMLGKILYVIFLVV